MASELNMYESQVSEYCMDLDRLQREMQEVKKKYFLQKKKEHALRYKTYDYTCIHYTVALYLHILLYNREKERQNMGPPMIPANKADLPRFTGGGFNLKQSQKAIA